jgi:PAS domain S-box-containing protein
VTDDEDAQLRSVAIQNAQAILLARQRAEQDLVAAKDALEQKTRELAHSLAMMRATLEATTDGILVTDADGNVTDFNEMYVTMWRLPREVLDSRRHSRVLEVISRGFRDPEAFQARVREINASGQETYDVLELGDGRVFERYSSIQLVDGRNVGRVWSVRDITDRRRAEDALREETRMLELLNKTGGLLSSKLDLQPLLQAVTDAAREVSGAAFGAFFYNTTDPNGDSYLLYTVSGARREDFEQFGEPRTTPLFAPTFNGEPPIRSDDVLEDPRYGQIPHRGMPASHLPVRSYLAVPVVSRSGEVIGGLFFGHPETGVFTKRSEQLVVGIAAQASVAIDNARLYAAAQTAAEERKSLLDSERLARADAERASAMKDEFLATLSHELRTPLNAILGWSKILCMPGVSPVDFQRGLEVVERNARIQAQLIEDLLDMSRITSGKIRLEIRPVSPAAVIEAALETVRPAAQAKGVLLTSALDPVTGTVAGDPARLQQVVWNLLSNAIKFTEKHGRIQVSLRRVGSWVAIAVADTGIGIPPEFLPHVFDRFRQADSSSTRTAGGLGLGLAIVKHLVELHGGAVRVQSAGRGSGTTFTIELPLVASVVQDDPVGERPRPRGRSGSGLEIKRMDLTGVKVLVVDDNADARALIQRVLEACGASVTTAGTVADAVLAVEHVRPHVLVSDVGMPEADGYELLRLVRGLGQARGGGLPAIALTAFARSEDRTRALRAGFLHHIAKPVEPSELVATVASVVGRTGEPLRE